MTLATSVSATVVPAIKLDVDGHINSSESYKLYGKTVLSKHGAMSIFVGEDAGTNNTTGRSNSGSGVIVLFSTTPQAVETRQWVIMLFIATSAMTTQQWVIMLLNPTPQAMKTQQWVIMLLVATSEAIGTQEWDAGLFTPTPQAMKTQQWVMGQITLTRKVQGIQLLATKQEWALLITIKVEMSSLATRQVTTRQGMINCI